MSISFRGGFLVGLALALCIGLYVVWLWQPARQVMLHTQNFFHAIERKDWAAAANFIGSDYQDQWGDDQARALERMQEGFRYVRGPRIIASNPSVKVETRRAVWTSKIMAYSADNDVMDLLCLFNREHGQTLVVVTHALEVGQRANRIIRMQDGNIV